MSTQSKTEWRWDGWAGGPGWGAPFQVQASAQPIAEGMLGKDWRKVRKDDPPSSLLHGQRQGQGWEAGRGRGGAPSRTQGLAWGWQFRGHKQQGTGESSRVEPTGPVGRNRSVKPDSEDLSLRPGSREKLCGETQCPAVASGILRCLSCVSCVFGIRGTLGWSYQPEVASSRCF